MIDKFRQKVNLTLTKYVRARREPDTGRTAGNRDRPGAFSDNERERTHVVDLLQSYRASENLNAHYVRLWAQVTPSERMRGGLRIVQAREGAHARLMRERLKELGETQLATVPQARQAQAIAFFSSRNRSDAKKLRVLKPMMDDFDAYFRHLVNGIESIHEDLYTREMLRTIIDDERATTTWFARMYKEL